MDDSRLINVNQLRQFLKGAQGLDVSLRAAGIPQRYGFIDQTIDRFQYHQLGWKHKRVVLAYLRKITGYRKAQLFRLVKKVCRGALRKKVYHRLRPRRRTLAGRAVWLSRHTAVFLPLVLYLFYSQTNITSIATEIIFWLTLGIATSHNNSTHGSLTLNILNRVPGNS